MVSVEDGVGDGEVVGIADGILSLDLDFPIPTDGPNYNPPYKRWHSGRLSGRRELGCERH